MLLIKSDKTLILSEGKWLTTLEIIFCVTSKSLEELTFETLNNSFKVKWLNNPLKGENNIWNTFPNYIFNMMGGLCDYKIEKLPTKLSNFYKQTLLAWKLIYKHNFSPKASFVWNNQDFQYK